MHFFHLWLIFKVIFGALLLLKKKTSTLWIRLLLMLKIDWIIIIHWLSSLEETEGTHSFITRECVIFHVKAVKDLRPESRLDFCKLMHKTFPPAHVLLPSLLLRLKKPQHSVSPFHPLLRQRWWLKHFSPIVTSDDGSTLTCRQLSSPHSKTRVSSVQRLPGTAENLHARKVSHCRAEKSIKAPRPPGRQQIMIDKTVMTGF